MRRGGPQNRQRIAAAVIAGSAAVLGMTGCGQVPPTGASTIAVPASPSASPSEPSPSTSESASSPPATPTTPTTPTPSLSATAGPQVKATGTLKLFAVASKKLAGTCAETGGVPVLKLADHKNDFFNTVDVALVLNPARKTVTSLTIDLGEDSELIKRTLTYDAAKPTSGSSAVLTTQGSTFKVTGKLASKEDGKDAGTMPVTLTVVCAGSDW